MTMKRAMRLAIPLCIVFIAGTAISWHNSDDRVKEEIGKVNRQYGESYVKGDSALYLQCYTPDACVLVAHAPQLCGQQGLMFVYKAARRMGVRNVAFTSLGFYGQTDEYVTEQGTYELFDEGQHSLDKGKFLVVWKKTAAGWQMFRDMSNSDRKPVH